MERWLGREPELRRRRDQVWAELEAFEESNADDGPLWIGDVVREIVAEAEEILRTLGP